jgi:hypothetical protein
VRNVLLLCVCRCVSWQQQKAAAQQQQQQAAMTPLHMTPGMMLAVLLLAVAGLALLRCWLLLAAAAWCWGRAGCGQTTPTTGWQQQVGARQMFEVKLALTPAVRGAGAPLHVLLSGHPLNDGCVCCCCNVTPKVPS